MILWTKKRKIWTECGPMRDPTFHQRNFFKLFYSPKYEQKCTHDGSFWLMMTLTRASKMEPHLEHIFGHISVNNEDLFLKLSGNVGNNTVNLEKNYQILDFSLHGFMLNSDFIPYCFLTRKKSKILKVVRIASKLVFKLARICSTTLLRIL